MKRKKPSIKQVLDQCWPTAPKHEVEAAAGRVWKRLMEELEKHDTSLRSLYGDGWSAEPLEQREFQVLTATSLLGDRATLATISGMVDDWTGREMIGHVYFTLSRLEERGLIKVRTERPTAYHEPQYHLDITEEGDRALRRAKAEGKQLVTAREDLDGPCPEGSGLLNDK